MSDKFAVSVKGVLFYEGKYLLRKNQRNEFELLGGRLEVTDKSAEERVIQEFLEESGIRVKVTAHREPWLYVIGKKNIIIVPFICSPVNIPNVLTDEDGGELEWISPNELDLLNMPSGYIDTIRNKIPRKSFSPVEGEFLKIIPNYTERDYLVKIVVRSVSGEVLFERELSHFISPRKFIYKNLRIKYNSVQLYTQPVGYENNIVCLNYIIF